MVYNVTGVDNDTMRFFNELADSLFDVPSPDERYIRGEPLTREEVITEIDKLCRLWTVTAKPSNKVEAP